MVCFVGGQKLSLLYSSTLSSSSPTINVLSSNSSLSLKLVNNTELEECIMCFNNFIGIDVSKDKIDIFSTKENSHFTIKNNAKEIKKFFKKFNALECFAVIENTGAYEKICLETLSSMNFTVHRTDNRKAKHFIQSLGKQAKTDKLDARGLALYGKERHAELKVYIPESPEYEALRELTLFLIQLKQHRASLKNELQSPGCSYIKNDIENVIKMLDIQIDNIKSKIHEATKQNQEMTEKNKLLTQIKGVAETTATNVQVLLPELGKLSKKEVASLAGLAPCANDSGKHRGYRFTGKGRESVRTALHMATMSAILCNKKISNKYNELIARGKNKMVALTACKRILLITMNAVVRDGEIKDPRIL